MCKVEKLFKVLFTLAPKHLILRNKFTQYMNELNLENYKILIKEVKEKNG